jgi:photosystem II stability/assembly factor-like uncharacterized protein
MQLRRSILLALLIITIIYFEIHSCSEDRLTEPNGTTPEASDLICGAGDLYFIDHDTGWVIGMLGTVMATTDGGDSWSGAVIPGVSLTDVFFIDRDRGWVVGRDGKIFRTYDGGATWERAIFSGTPQSTDLFEIRFMNDTLGFTLAYDGVYRTTDGGALWENHWLPVIPKKGAWNMSIIDDRTVYLLGSSWMDPDPELIHKTMDGGSSWCAVEGSESSVLRAVMTIEFIDEYTGWAGGGVIMKTSDGGESWMMQREEATVREFHFCDTLRGYAVGGRTILRTEDGGQSWHEITPVCDRIADLRAVYFLDARHGYVVGRGTDEPFGSKLYKVSLVFETNDGGDTWSTADFLFDYTPYMTSDADREGD